MRSILLSSLLISLITLGMSQASYAFCNFVGPNGPGSIIDCPDPVQLTPLDPGSTPSTTVFADIITVPPGGGLVVDGDFFTPTVNTSAGADMVTVAGQIIQQDPLGAALFTASGADSVIVNTGAEITGGTGIATSFQPDFVQINGGSVVGTTVAAIFTGTSGDTVEVNGGNVDGGFFLSFSTDTGDDMLRINDGTFNGPISMFTGDDTAFLNGGTYNFLSIGMGPGDDVLHVTTDIPDLGLMSCGENLIGEDDDRLIFSMQVPADQVQQLSEDFINAGENGSLEVNGITYSWVFCENRIPNFNGVVANITLTPFTAENPLGTDHTVDAVVNSTVGPQVGVEVNFSVSEGPNAGADSGSEGVCAPNPDCTTDANGEVSWTYTSNGIPGTDEIIASVDDIILGTVTSNVAGKDWIVVRNVPTLSEWGLIAMASLLGIVGFMVIRRRQLTA